MPRSTWPRTCWPTENAHPTRRWSSRLKTGDVTSLTLGELRTAVVTCAAALASEGVTAGDRVAAWMPNTSATLIAMLATISLGAVFSSTSPDFDPDGVVDRFGQIEPTVLFRHRGILLRRKVLRLHGTFGRDHLEAAHAAAHGRRSVSGRRSPLKRGSGPGPRPRPDRHTRRRRFGRRCRIWRMVGIVHGLRVALHPGAV